MKAAYDELGFEILCFFPIFLLLLFFGLGHFVSSVLQGLLDYCK